MIRYYATVHPPEFTKEKPAGLTRVIHDADGLTVEIFNRKGQWEEYFDAYKPIIDGDLSRVEISELDAQQVLGRWGYKGAPSERT